MNVFSERSRSIWMDLPWPDFPRLDHDLTADVVVIGSGIAGLSTAYELARQGSSVIVIDRGPVGRGMTARTTAHLSSPCDDLVSELIKKRGKDAARDYYLSQEAAIDRIGAIAGEEGIECDYARLDAYLYAAKEEDEKILDKEVEACREIGVEGIAKLATTSFDGLSKYPVLRFPRQGRVHPTKYLRGLAEAILPKGGRIFGDTAVTEVREEDGAVRATTANGHEVSAASAVVATNSPINDRVAIHPKQAPYRTYAFAAPIPAKSTIEDVLYWDTEDPYHYVRRHPFAGGDVLIVGGEDHKSGEADDMEARFRRLEAWARERFPALGEVRTRWSGQCMIPVDFVGMIGRNPNSRNVYIATGDSGQGITTGALAGMMLADLVQGRESPWEETYSPARKPVAAIKELVSENLTAVKGLAEHLGPGEISSADELGPGQGGLLRKGMHKHAVSRDESGRLRELSGSCTHLGCAVHWNPFEQCWDCPCHGSHFAPDGTVLNAPAVEPLKPA